jgi:hypothetical protein
MCAKCGERQAKCKHVRRREWRVEENYESRDDEVDEEVRSASASRKSPDSSAAAALQSNFVAQ